MVLQLMPPHRNLIALFTDDQLVSAVIFHVGFHEGSMHRLATFVGTRDDTHGALLLDMPFQLTQRKVLAAAVVRAAESCLFDDVSNHEVKGRELPSAEGALSLVCTALATEEALASLTLIGVRGVFVAACAFDSLKSGIFACVEIEQDPPVVLKIVVFLRLLGH